MRYNQLGRTGLFVSEICLGAMTFGEAGGSGIWGTIAGVDQKAANRIVERSLAAGVNFIDTADVYSFGDSERMVGQALVDLGVRRKDVVIATKVLGEMGDKPNDRGASRGHIMDSVRGSLERLQTNHIDLYQIHGTDSVTPIDETLRALDDLVSLGMVSYIGLSNWQAWRIAKALGVSAQRGFARYETVQAYYSIAGRDLEREIVPLLAEEKLGLMVWSPLAGGLLSGKYGPGAPEGGEGRRANFDFPPVDRERAWKCVAAMREIGVESRRQRGGSGARLDSRQTIRDQRHYRREANRAAGAEFGGDQVAARSRGDGGARRGERIGRRISRLDAGAPRRDPSAGAVYRGVRGRLRASRLFPARCFLK